MDELICKIVAHQLHDLEPLGKMERLTGGGDINALVEIIGALAVDRRGDIARRIQRRAVGFEDQARWHVVGREIDERCAVIQLQKPLFPQKLHLLRHFVGVERLAVVAVEGDAELTIRFFIFRETDLLEPFPKLEIFLVAVLELCKFRTGGIRKGGCARFFLRFDLVVYAHIKRDKLVDAAFFDLLPVAPLAIGDNELPELRSPVSEMVDAHTGVARVFMEQL